MCCDIAPVKLYFGLRDYGTAQWDGGDVGCDHRVRKDPRIASSTLGGGKGTTGHQQEGYRRECGRCGAVRIDNQIGLEPTLSEYIAALVDVFREVRRVLRDDGVCFLNLGDSYNSSTQFNQNRSNGLNAAVPYGEATGEKWGGHRPMEKSLKPKDLMMVPARVAIALQDDGWYLRSHIIWAKKAPMPESVQGSQFTRHQVTIAEYERLSGLRYTPERYESDGTSYLSGVPARKETGEATRVPQDGQGARTESPLSSDRQVPPSQAPLSAERQGQSDRTSAGRTPGRSGEATVIQSLGSGTAQSSEIRGDAEGQSDKSQSVAEVSEQRARQDSGRDAAPTDQRPAAPNRAATPGEREVRQVRENGGQETPGLRAAKGSGRSIKAGNGSGLDDDPRSAWLPLPLLQDPIHSGDAGDDGSCDSGEQGRAACDGEYRPGLPLLQLQEEQQTDPTLLVDCPGCDKCREHGGYLLRWNAGRPTSAHESIFLLTKQPKYFWDADAVAEPTLQPPGDPKLTGQHKADADGFWNNGKNGSTLGTNQGAATRNLRNVWTLGPDPYPGAHFAVMPREIARRCIKAGTSEKGCCAACGAPWVRVVERTAMEIRRSDWGDGAGTRTAASGTMVTPPTSITTGWEPGCTCDAGVQPCTVLDPFGGSGTTALVADQIDRHAILIELNPEYANQARERISGAAPLFASVETA